jgi:hypothetical protein
MFGSFLMEFDMIGQQMITEARLHHESRGRTAVMPLPIIHRNDNAHLHTFFLSLLRPISDLFDRFRTNH